VAVVRELLAKSSKHASSSHNGKVAAAAGGASLFFMKVTESPSSHYCADPAVLALCASCKMNR
jgi:hypothetical protein